MVVHPASHKISRVSWYSGFQLLALFFVYGSFTLYGASFPTELPLNSTMRMLVRNPERYCYLSVWAFSAFARHYLRNLGWFLLLWVLRCFSSPRFPTIHYVFMYGWQGINPCRVSPFGNLRINGYLRLSAAYRSLSRPSSASGAKAFTLCS